MPASQVVLIVGAVVLGCGSLGFLAVRLSNPLLRAMGWLGAAFGVGSLSALGLLLPAKDEVVGLVSGLFGLAVFVLLQVAVQALIEAKSLIPRSGLVLLCLLTFTYAVTLSGHHSADGRTVFTGFLIALQAALTASRLFRHDIRESRTPARFTAVVLTLFALLVSIRCFAATLGLLDGSIPARSALMVMFTIYTATLLGIGFGLFWMSANILTASLEQMASTDPLTRIYNRRMFLMWCDRELERNQRGEDHPFSILMIDLDRFKAINDRYGHATGDEALCAAVEKMQDSIRGIDVLGRWGGEEFAVLLPHAPVEASLLVAERVRANIARIALPAREMRLDEALEAIRVTASIGVATYQGGGDSVEAMVRRADQCLYQAKATGRNRVVSTSESTHDNHGGEKRTTDLLRDPLEVSVGVAHKLIQ